ncbi:unnamed protein product [Psylliodes chrysocephalus]|uniref:G-protein coupled receptors family 2 profile 2 domain-containing protein n=1 Tax=Psylliodes chrysocephalus TaxID=3402493 RepID=A0A9P0CDB7_9CUCU|nr:unnamed protein product [Psylliodes chrysocephala]
METRSSIFLCLLFSLCFAQESQPCSPSSPLTIDLSNASVHSNNVFKLDSVIYNQSNYYIEDSGKKKGCLCNIKNCIRKCCGRNSFMNDTKDDNFCENSANVNFSLDVYHETEKKYHGNLNNFTMLFGYDCPENLHSFRVDSSDQIFIQENGTLYYADWMALYNLDSYCVDFFQDNELSAMVCEPYDEEADTQRTVNSIGLLISMPFLFLTFLVYAVLPKRNLHRRALMCYVICALGGNITLIIVNLVPYKLPDVPCHLLGYLIIYFFLGSFIWLNVMCIDMWLAFSSSTGFLSKKTTEKKRFIMYSIYAWGVPFCFVTMVLIINTHGHPKSHFYPNLGSGACFLAEGWPMFYFFYLPIGILLTVNILLFIVTSLKIFKIKGETKMLKRTDSKIHTHEDDKQKFNLYVKLMFAMGVNWITEIISWGVSWKTEKTHAEIFYLTDFTNAMYGFVIFLIFVFKKKIWRGLQKRYYVYIGKPELAPSTSTRTRTSNCSTDSVVSISTDNFVNASPRGPEEIPLNRKHSK